jgi:ketosteroid isomerase-like protein
VVTTVTSIHAAALQKFRTDQIKSTLDGNPAMLSAYYDRDIRLMTESVGTVLGRTNALAYYQAFSGRFSVKAYTRDEMEIIDLDSRVVEVGQFTIKLVAKNTGKEYTLAGKYMDIWAESETGGLSLVTSAWNYNHELEVADELRFAGVPVVLMAFQAHVPVRDRISFELAALNKLAEVAVSEHDAAKWSLFFSDDAILLPGHTPFCRGRKAIDGYLVEHVKQLPVFEKLDIRNDRIDDLGDYVIEYATHVANWRNGDSSGVGTGKDIRIWRRAPNGSLQLFRQIGAYD